MSDLKQEPTTANSPDEQSNEFTGAFDASDNGVSEQEKAEILAQLDSFVVERAKTDQEHQFQYEARHKRDILPALIGVGATLLGAVAAVTLFFVFERQEQTLLSDAASAETAEAQLLQEFRAEAKERLAAQEGEIQRIREELTTLESERDAAIQDAEAEFVRREEELEQRLEEALAAERERLEEQGFTGEELEARLAEVESDLEAQHSGELEQLRADHEEAIAEREAQLAALETEFESGLEQLSEFRHRQEQTAEELAELTEQRSQERHFAGRLTEQYERAIELLEAGNYGAVQAVVEDLEALLSEEEIERLPAIRDRAPVDRELVAALRRLSELEQQDPAGLATELESTERTLGEREAELTQSERTIGNLRQQLSSVRQERTEARAQVQRLRGELRSVQNELAQEASTLRDGPADLSEVIASVDVRLEVLDALRSDAIRREHPELDEAFEEYLDTFGRAHEQRGFASGLVRAADMLDNSPE